MPCVRAGSCALLQRLPLAREQPLSWQGAVAGKAENQQDGPRATDMSARMEAAESGVPPPQRAPGTSGPCWLRGPRPWRGHAQEMETWCSAKTAGSWRSLWDHKPAAGVVLADPASRVQKRPLSLLRLQVAAGVLCWWRGPWRCLGNGVVTELASLAPPPPETLLWDTDSVQGGAGVLCSVSRGMPAPTGLTEWGGTHGRGAQSMWLGVWGPGPALRLQPSVPAL